jgi:hypothetical protein
VVAQYGWPLGLKGTQRLDAQYGGLEQSILPNEAAPPAPKYRQVLLARTHLAPTRHVIPNQSQPHSNQCTSTSGSRQAAHWAAVPLTRLMVQRGNSLDLTKHDNEFRNHPISPAREAATIRSFLNPC